MVELQKIHFIVLRGVWTWMSYRSLLWLGVVSSAVTVIQLALTGVFLKDGNRFSSLDGYGGDIISFLITGSIFTSLVATTINSCGSILQVEQNQGTLESIAVSRTNPMLFVLYGSFLEILGSLTGSMVMLVVFMGLFQTQIHGSLLHVLVTLLLVILSLLGISMTSAGILTVTKKGDPVGWVFTILTSLISGVLFPVQYLPGPVQTVSQWLPTTQALHGVRLALASPALTPELLDIWKQLLVTGAVLLTVGTLVFRWGNHQARKHGTLGEH